MGRMYGSGKGISSSALPYRRRAPTWLKMRPDEVRDHICKLAKKGLSPSQIGVTLRDSFGIPQVKNVTGSKILRILKAKGLAPEVSFFPQRGLDLLHLRTCKHIVLKQRTPELSLRRFSSHAVTPTVIL